MSGNVFVSPYSPVQQSGTRAKNPPDMIIAGRIPLAKDYAYFPGTIWLYINTGAWILVGSPMNVANWQAMTAASAGVTTIVGTGGGSTPVLGAISITGTGGTTVTSTGGSGGVITINSTGLSWAINNAGGASVTNNGYIITAGTATFTLPAASNVGDQLGFVLEGGVQWKVTSNGNLQFGTTIILSGHFLQSSANGATVILLCTVANSTWIVLSTSISGSVQVV